MRDLKSNVMPVHTLAPAARTTGTATGVAVDRLGYDSLLAIFHVGNWTDGTHTPSLFESDDGTTYTEVGTADLQGAFTAVSGTAQENAAQRVGYIGKKRYVKGMLVSGSSTTGVDSGMVILKGHPSNAPAA